MPPTALRLRAGMDKYFLLHIDASSACAFNDLRPRHPSAHRNLILRSTNFYPSSSTTLNTLSSPSGASTLSYHLITKQFALLALLLSTVYEERRGLVEYSVVFFRQGVQEICAEEYARVGEEVLSRNRSFTSSLCDFRVLWIVIRISC